MQINIKIKTSNRMSFHPFPRIIIFLRASAEYHKGIKCPKDWSQGGIVLKSKRPEKNTCGTTIMV
jgi:hypothetical protein